jgi:hypothetical protein
MTPEIQKHVADAFRLLLRPLVRILLRYEIPLGVLIEYAKQAYVDVAASEFTVPGRKPSISRISLLTRLTRKEVSRLVKAEEPWKEVSRLVKAEEPSAVPIERYNRAARVLTGWTRDPAFHDRSGRTASLEIEGPGGFADLVRRHGGDVPHRAVLDELLRVAAVDWTRDGRLRLRSRAYVPATGEDQKLAILGTDVADLVNVIDHNLTHPPGEALFQRKVAYDNLVDQGLPDLRSQARRRAQALLETLDRSMARQDRDANPRVQGTGRNRAVLGIYYLEQPMEAEA